MDNLTNLPNSEGFFGDYGGKFVPETLMYALKELDETYMKLKNEPKFLEEIDQDLLQFVGRPSPLYLAKRLTDHYSGPQIWLKREDLNHTGAHKINNTVGQILLAKAMGKKELLQKQELVNMELLQQQLRQGLVSSVIFTWEQRM